MPFYARDSIDWVTRVSSQARLSRASIVGSLQHAGGRVDEAPCLCQAGELFLDQGLALLAGEVQRGGDPEAALVAEAGARPSSQ